MTNQSEKNLPETVTVANVTPAIVAKATLQMKAEQDRLYLLDAAISKAQWDAKVKAEQEVREKFDAERRAISTGVWDLKKYVADARMALALSGQACIVPLGTQFIQWEKVADYAAPRTSRYSQPMKWQKTGLTGTVEVVTDLSTIAERQHGRGDYGVQLGSVVIRPTLKSGKPGKEVALLDEAGRILGRYGSNDGWFLEGANPAEAERVKREEQAAREAAREAEANRVCPGCGKERVAGLCPEPSTKDCPSMVG